MDHLAHLAGVEPRREDLEDGADDGLDVGRPLAYEHTRDLLQELVEMPLPGRGPGRMPLLVVEPPHEHRQLRAEVHGELRRQAVAQRVQRATQS